MLYNRLGRNIFIQKRKVVVGYIAVGSMADVLDNEMPQRFDSTLFKYSICKAEKDSKGEMSRSQPLFEHGIRHSLFSMNLEVPHLVEVQSHPGSPSITVR